MALLDRIAELTMMDDPAFPEVRANYEGDARLRMPSEYLVDSQRFDLRSM